MAYSKQTWDTTSYVNPTRMNHIEDGIEAVDTKTADDIEYSSGVSVKDKIDDVDGKTDNTVKTLQGYAPNDLNNCVNGNVYWVNNSGGNVQHAPSQNAFHIFTFLTIPNYGFQMAIQYTSNQIYLRTMTEGSWGTWKSVNLS